MDTFRYLGLKLFAVLGRQMTPNAAEAKEALSLFPPSQTLTIPSTYAKREIALYVWEPESGALADETGKWPVHINWHASGFSSFLISLRNRNTVLMHSRLIKQCCLVTEWTPSCAATYLSGIR